MSTPGAHIGQVSPERACTLLHSSPGGLDPREVAERLAHLGANSFEVVDRWKLARALGRQFTNFRPPDLDTFTWRRVQAVTF